MAPTTDLLFIKIALKNEALDRSQVQKLLTRQQAGQEGEEETSLGVLALEAGYLDRTQLKRILSAQRYMEIRTEDKHRLQILIDLELVSSEQGEECVAIQKKQFDQAHGEPFRIGEILVEQGYATARQVARATGLQETNRFKTITGDEEDTGTPELVQDLRDTSHFIDEVLDEFGIDRKEAEQEYASEIGIYRTCPFCDETILASSSICKFCHEKID